MEDLDLAVTPRELAILTAGLVALKFMWKNETRATAFLAESDALSTKLLAQAGAIPKDRAVVMAELQGLFPK